MPTEIDGQAELLLTPEEEDDWDAQVDAKKSATHTKTEVSYQNHPNGTEQCSNCHMFVPGFPSDPGNYCTEVIAIRGPIGMIYTDGWCKMYRRREE